MRTPEPGTLAAVQAILAELTLRPTSDIRPDDRLEDGLGLDSLSMIHLTVSLEERFAIAVPPGASAAELGITTVSDLAGFVDTLRGGTP